MLIPYNWLLSSAFQMCASYNFQIIFN